MGIQNFFIRIEPIFKKGLILALCLYFILIQFSISTPYIHLLPLPTPAVLTLGVGILTLFFWLFYRSKLDQGFESNKVLKYFTLAFSISIFLAILSSFYTIGKIQSTEYLDFISDSMIKRVLYYGSYLMLLYFGYIFIANLKDSNIRRIINMYSISLFLLVIVGIWQLLYFFYNIPFLDIETRSYVHSVEGNTFFNFRLTSFADEPSYLGPVLIDMVILGFLIFKRKWLYGFLVALPALGILLFSFSVSAYLNLFVLVFFVFVYLIFHPKFPKRYLWYLLGILIVGLLFILIIKPDFVVAFFSPILGRLGGLFDPQTSSRMYMYLMPFYWLFDHSTFSALFGYGPGAFDFLHASKIMPSNVSVATSSNNMYIDLLFEHGIIGFLLIASALVYLGIVLWKKGRLNVFYFIALLEFVHILFTSLYRADFVTPRFWGGFLIIFLLMRLGENHEKRRLEKKGDEKHEI